MVLKEIGESWCTDIQFQWMYCTCNFIKKGSLTQPTKTISFKWIKANFYPQVPPQGPTLESHLRVSPYGPTLGSHRRVLGPTFPVSLTHGLFSENAPFQIFNRALNTILSSHCHKNYNQFHNTLRLFDVLPNFTFTTSETMCNYYL